VQEISGSLQTSVQRRRRWTPEQKLEIVKQTNEPGNSVSMVARQFGITAAQLFQWRKAYLQGSLMAVGANETVVPASELQEAMRRIKQSMTEFADWENNERS
jgi:transposase